MRHSLIRERVLPRVFEMIFVVLIVWVGLPSASTGAVYRLDESGGLLTVVGWGRPPSEARHPAQARLLAERAAVVGAYETAARLLSEALPQVASGQEGPSVFLRGASIASSHAAPDGSVQVELEIPLTPDLAARVREAIGRREAAVSLEGEAADIVQAEFAIRHRIVGPRPIPRREWTERYRSGEWKRGER